MKTIVILACCDTKHFEVDFLRGRITQGGFGTLVIDASTSRGFSSVAEVPRERLAAEVGLVWSEIESRPKHELLDVVARGASEVATRLYREGRLHGIISVGGLQNTIVGSAAMMGLPIGVPKVIVSTVASGQRTFDTVVGDRDITVVPSICDMMGMNLISETVLGNAAGAIMGMLEHAGHELPKPQTPLIGTTLMGATNDGVVRAARRLEQKGHHIVAFHSTGVGGKVMEELIADATLSAALDLTLHEIVYEYFGAGFGFGASGRLTQGVRKGIPMVVCPGGIDFICQWKGQLFPDASARKMIWHNSALAHVKLTAQEAADISRIIVGRLNAAAPGKVVVVIPTRGLRTFAKEGQPLHDPVVDQAVFDVFEQGLRKDIPVRFVDAGFDDDAFSAAAADEMDALLRVDQ
jgi:uncharacterized protein (UPF0261 family)